MGAAAERYPEHREADVALRDGSTVHVRPVQPGDEEAILALLRGLSDDARAMRFFSGGANLERVAAWAANVDHRDRFGLVATAGRASRVVAHASYARTDRQRAEIAFEVADDYRGRGVGTILLAHLAEAALENGIAQFDATVLPRNHRMIEVFRESGFPVETRTQPGELVVTMPTLLTSVALERFEDRDRVASVAALRAFLSPRSVAVIGAGRTRGTIGGEVFHNLLAAGFNGPVYPVNPRAEVVQSVPAFPSVGAIPSAADLAVIVVPAAAVLDVARECAEKGVRALVVISAGFAETGDDGRARQRALLRICRESGMRLIGPNCMGIINASPEVRLNATFAPTFPPHGRVGFLSQSGALGLAVIDNAAALGLGLSSFVSVGNKADVSGNDLIQYWEDDGDTDLILLYLESFGNPRRFARIARRVARGKPIVAVKSGRSAAGARATSSHTGALLAASDRTVDALFRQAGVIRVDTLSEMFDVASLLANQPLPTGPNVAIVTNAGGPGILCADTCEANGLQVIDLPGQTRERLRAFLPPEASVANPVDMIASASAEDYRRTIQTLAACENVDAIIVIFIPPLVTRAEDVARAIRGACVTFTRPTPLLTVFMSARGVPPELHGDGVVIPSYAFPEDAARALVHAVNYGVWRERAPGRDASFDDVRRDEAAAAIAGALGRDEGWLDQEEVAALLDCYGIALPESRLADDSEGAGRAAAEMGGAVALKAIGPTLLHKTDVGAVVLGLEGRDDVRDAASRMRARLEGAGHGVDRFLVQRMVPGGVEMLVGVVHDPVFGPVVACGSGGTTVELLNDVAVRITPLTDVDASEMLRSLRTFPLLTGYRGAAKADVAALETLLLRIGTMVEDHPEIVEMDCNPVMVLSEGDGAIVVDARVRVATVERPPPLGARRPPTAV